jgi:hypothetical protein
MVVAIIKLNDPVTDHSIFRWGRSEYDIPKNSTKPETPVRIFTMMMDMILVQMWKQLFRPGLVQYPMAKKRISKSHFQPGKNCEIAVPKNCNSK